MNQYPGQPVQPGYQQPAYPPQQPIQQQPQNQPPPPKFPELTDFLAMGKHIIEVEPKPLFGEDNKPIPGSQKSGTNQHGKPWYMFQTRINGTRINLFANEGQKWFFDTGKIEVNIIQKFDTTTGQPIMRAYYNPQPGVLQPGIQPTTPLPNAYPATPGFPAQPPPPQYPQPTYQQPQQPQYAPQPIQNAAPQPMVQPAATSQPPVQQPVTQPPVAQPTEQPTTGVVEQQPPEEVINDVDFDSI